jgi:hypothetical protein
MIYTWQGRYFVCDHVFAMTLSHLVSIVDFIISWNLYCILCIGEYLLQEKCPWSYRAQETARFFGHYELEKWLIAKGCPRRKH